MSTVSNLNRSKRNRDRLEIVRDILSVASVKTRKTRIMYQCNLNHQLLEKHLTNLLKSGLLESVDDSFYLITEEGERFLQMYETYLKRCSRIRREINRADEDRSILDNICFNNAAFNLARARIRNPQSNAEKFA